MEDYNRKSYLDNLRGVAILGVVCVHSVQEFSSGSQFLDSALAYGRAGVVLFFVLSAVTMCHVWTTKYGDISIREYYSNRIRRILPPYYLAIILYVLVLDIDMSYWSSSGVGWSEVLLNASFLHGFSPEAINSVVPGGWSLASEMFFYAIFPFVAIGIRRYGIEFSAVMIVISAIYTTFAGDFFSSIRTDTQAPLSRLEIDFLFLCPLQHLPAFWTGIFIYHVFILKSKIRNPVLLIATILVWAGVTLHSADFRLITLGLSTILFGLITILSSQFFNSRNTLGRIGRNSYEIYLLHPAVIHIISIICDRLDYNLNFVGAFALTLLLSFLCSDLISRALRKGATSL